MPGIGISTGELEMRDTSVLKDSGKAPRGSNHQEQSFIFSIIIKNFKDTEKLKYLQIHHLNSTIVNILPHSLSNKNK